MFNATSDTRQKAIEEARRVVGLCPVYLDTETTGLERDDEIIEIAIIDDEGQILFESLVKPRKRIPADATRVHHITNTHVENASAWPIVWTKAKEVLQGKLIVMYNDDFDLRMMKQSYLQYNLRWNEKLDTFDLLKLYAQFRGEWDYKHGHYRYHSLANAGIACGIGLPNAHRASADILLTRALLHHIAQAGS